MTVMQQVPQWLREMIPWVFSGVGVAAAGAFWSWIRRRTSARDGSIRIDSPRSGDRVGRVALISGFVAPPTSTVAVVVHPMTDQYYPQRKVSVRNDGFWAVEVLVGSVNSTERGARFEIVAVADPITSVTEVLNDWPAARARSDVIQVFRE